MTYRSLIYRTAIFIALSASLLSSDVSASIQIAKMVAPISFTEHTITSNFDGARSVYATDLDGDNDVDVLGAAEVDDEIAWWENGGNENFTKQTITSNFNGAFSVYAVDVDSDGDVDVLGTAFHGHEIAWFENNGNESFTKHIIDNNFREAASVYATDVDSDGDIDVLGASFLDYDISWWENDGNENFTEHNIADNFDDAISVYATDIDGDGDVDVLGAAYYTNKINWWENDGNENFAEHTITNDFPGPWSAYASDVDGDGNIDILGASYSGHEIAWWKNDGNENFTKHIVADNFRQASSVYTADLDGDGDLDILGASTYSSNNPIKWWENTGSVIFIEHNVSDDFNGARSVYATDVDSDGDVDVLGAANGDDAITWWESEIDPCASEKDSDGDGLLDGWESCGYDYDNDGVIDVDLPSIGVDPKHIDILVEIDYMGIGPNEDKSHQPKPRAIEEIVNSFANSPVKNPNGATGIHLHVDYGATAPLTWGLDNYWGDLSQADELKHQEYIGTCPLGIKFLWSQFDSIKLEHFNNDARGPIFHYNIWAHKLCDEKSTTSGVARGAGSDFIVSLNQNPFWDNQALTFMHELGHNLGLLHGGDDNVNYKPNYLSVMNYSFQREGLPSDPATRRFDYSRWELPDLNELNLNETNGIGVPLTETTVYGTIWYCSFLDKNVNGKSTGDASVVDWNCDKDEQDKWLVEDINRDFIPTNLKSYSDWANLVYDGGAIGGFGIGEELPSETVVDELTEEEALTIPSIYHSYLYLPTVLR